MKLLTDEKRLDILKKAANKLRNKRNVNNTLLEALEDARRDIKTNMERRSEGLHAIRNNPVILRTENFIVMYRNIAWPKVVYLDRSEEGIKNQIQLEIRNGKLDLDEYKTSLEYFAQARAKGKTEQNK